MSSAVLYLTRVGRHDCYDRVVFDVQTGTGSAELGEVVGSAASYVPLATADPSDEELPVAGNAVIEITVKAPILGLDSQGHQPWRPAPPAGQSLVAPRTLTGWRSLRAVVLAGSFEGETTVAVGVREKRPFRLWVLRDRGYQRVVLDIAH